MKTETGKPGPLLWALLALALWASLSARGSDLQRGITFTDGQRLTASQLHSLVDNATVVTGFYLNKPATTSLESGATLLIYSPAAQAFERITASSFLYGNTDFITTAPEKAAPAPNDYVIIYDATGTVLAKASLANIWSNSIAQQPFIQASNIAGNVTVQVENNSTNGQTTFTNLLSALEFVRSLTNLTAYTAPAPADGLLIYDSAHGLNKEVILTNLLPVTVVYDNLTVTNSYMVYTNNPFGGAGHVEVHPVLVTRSQGVGTSYNIADEIPANRFNNSGSTPAFSWGSNSTNVWFAGRYTGNYVGSGDLNFPTREGGNLSSAISVNHTNFIGRVYVTFYPTIQ